MGQNLRPVRTYRLHRLCTIEAVESIRPPNPCGCHAGVVIFEDLGLWGLSLLVEQGFAQAP